MTTTAPTTYSLTSTSWHGPVTGSARGDPAASIGLERPDSRTIVVWAAGELDALPVPYLEQLLRPRLTSTAQTVVLDLAQVTFLSVDALKLLDRCHHRAQIHCISLRLVTGPIEVTRALAAGSLAECLATYRSRADALAGSAAGS